jgi:hypothetical protein
MAKTVDTVYKILNSLSALHCPNYMQGVNIDGFPILPSSLPCQSTQYTQTSKWLVAMGGGYGVASVREHNKKVKPSIYQTVEAHRGLRRRGYHIF